jgi:CO/xanthine dehydrogenase FAD-binding subunit
MKPAKLRYIRAETADQAVELLGTADGRARILAGGQSLIPTLSARSISVSLLVDIMQCPGLEVASQTATEVTVGAACRQSHIERNPLIRDSVPLLSEALTWVAMPQVRSRGTVVGCLAQANAGGEVPVVSLALDAGFNILLRGSARLRMPAEDVYDAEAGTNLPRGSLILSASFRRRAAGEGWGFSEVQLRPGHFALVCCAATLLLEESGHVRSARIALGGLTASPYRARRAEEVLLEPGRDLDSAILHAAHLAPVERPWPARTDLHATAAFREKAAVVVVARALRDAQARCPARTGVTNDRA